MKYPLKNITFFQLNDNFNFWQWKNDDDYDADDDGNKK